MTTPSGRWLSVLGLLSLGGLLGWAYWPTVCEVADRWSTDSRYSHGYLVPAFALVPLWLRRRQLAALPLEPSWWGVPLLAAGVAAHLGGAYFYFDWVGAAALLPCLAGLCLCLGGWPLLGIAWPAIAFLIFMLPLPYRLEVALAYPLQHVATIASTYVLQTLGFPAVTEGNVILIEDVRIMVVEACNGLGMMVTFFALTTAVAILLRRPWLDRAVLVLSALPLAVMANLVRITATGILAVTVGGEIANRVFHDLAGWLMMPLALGLMWIELQVLSRLLVEPPPADEPVFDFRCVAPVGAGARP